MDEKPIHWLGSARNDIRRFPETVYVLHAFTKKTRKTPKHEHELARTRYRKLVEWRRSWQNN